MTLAAGREWRLDACGTATRPGPRRVGADKNGAMHATEVERAITATTALVSELGLVVGEAGIVGNSHKLGLRLLPCDVFARAAVSGQAAYPFAVESAPPRTPHRDPGAPL